MVTALSREDRVLGSIRPFRLSTSVEIATMRRVFVRLSGLNVGQFAENSFGFPFIPYPEIDPTNVDKVKLSPANTSPAFVFHPIYWIDPRLTAPTEEEFKDPARWSVRMFYELLSFGLLNPETLQWLNPAVVRGVKYSPADIDSFLNSAPSVLDQVVFRDDERIPGYSSSDVLEATEVALERIRAIQQREVSRIRALRNSALADTQAVMSGTDNWRTIYERLAKVATEIDQSRASGMPISSYVDEVYAAKTDVARYLASIDDAILGLSYDIADQSSYSNDAIVKFAAIAALTKRGKGLVSKYESELDNYLANLFTKNPTVDGNSMMVAVVNMYNNVMERLALAYRNFERNQLQQPVIKSIDAQAFSESNRMEQALEDDFR